MRNIYFRKNVVQSKLINFYRGVRDNYQNLRKELDKIELLYAKNRKEFDALKALHLELTAELATNEFTLR